MTRSAAGPIGALAPPGARKAATAWRRPTAPLARWRQHDANDRYSRRVRFLKRMLPAIGLTLLLLVSVWPKLHPLLQQVRLAFNAIDLREVGSPRALWRRIDERERGLRRTG